MKAETPERAAKETYKAMSGFVNAYQFHTDLIAQELVSDHKLLQHYVIQMCLACIKAMAEMPEDRVTVQNEAAVGLCRRIMEVV